jgi:hypothetical protein
VVAVRTFTSSDAEPAMMWHSTSSGSSASAALVSSPPIHAFPSTITNASTGNPTATGSTSMVVRRMTPRSRSLRTRS